MATQTLWQRKPKQMRINITGELGFGVSGKDVILAIIREISAAGGTGYAIEFAGSAIEKMSMEGRMTVCNMAIEAGARSGIIAPDDKTIEYCKGRPLAPTGADWDTAEAYWRTLPSDADAVYDKEVTLDGDAIAPMVTWGNSPQWALPVTEAIPDPSQESDPLVRADMEAALDYMDLKPAAAIYPISKSIRSLSGPVQTAGLKTCARRRQSPRARKAQVRTLIAGLRHREEAGGSRRPR